MHYQKGCHCVTAEYSLRDNGKNKVLNGARDLNYSEVFIRFGPSLTFGTIISYRDEQDFVYYKSLYAASINKKNTCPYVERPGDWKVGAPQTPVI
ncbi:MAG: hypothetical protein KAX28_00585 [Candidatus Marinimicrobia bacterium]|nr:hypothetical protein [Candidatus Neomarinimicrobiota bacterium]